VIVDRRAAALGGTHEGHVEAIKALVQLGAQLGAQPVGGKTRGRGRRGTGRMAVELIEEEEREKAARAQTKVRVAPLSLASMSDAASLSRGERLSAQCVVCSGDVALL
jgi:hypothetical protein